MILIIFLSLMLSFSVTLALAIMLWPYRRTQLHRFLFFTQVTYVAWSFLILACIISDDFGTKVVLTQMRQLFLPLLTPTWALIAFGVFFKERYEKVGRWKYLIYVLPAAVILGNIAGMAGLSMAQSWTFYDFKPPANATNLLSYTYGPLLKLNFAYIYLLIFVVVLSLSYVAIKNRGVLRLYGILLCLASFLYPFVDFLGRTFFPDQQIIQLGGAGTWPAALILYYVIHKLEFLDFKALAQQKVFESLPSPVLTVNPDGQLWDANLAGFQTFSITSEVFGTPVKQIPQIKNLLSDEENISLNDHTYQVFRHHIKIRGGEETAKVFILNDITRMIALNSELQDSNQALRELNEEILRVTEFNKKVQSVLSHDLTGSLSGLKILLEGMKQNAKDRQDEESVQFLRKAHQASTSAINLLQDILAWSHDQQALYWVSLEGVLKNAVQQLTPQILEKSVRVEMQLPERDVQLRASKKMLEAIFRNLLSNAIRFSKNNDAVQINVKCNGPQVQVSVSDNGVGMSPEKIQILLLQSYQQLEAEGEFGLGLGLKFTFDFVRQLKGDIQISSFKGEGSTFTVSLPIENT